MVRVDYNDSLFSIYKNPDLKEYEQLLKDHNEHEEDPKKRINGIGNLPLRVLLDLDNECIFVFDFNLIHERVATKLGKSISENYMYLYGKYKNGKIECDNVFPKKDIEKYSFIEKYFIGYSVK